MFFTYMCKHVLYIYAHACSLHICACIFSTYMCMHVLYIYVHACSLHICAFHVLYIYVHACYLHICAFHVLYIYVHACSLHICAYKVSTYMCMHVLQKSCRKLNENEHQLTDLLHWLPDNISLLIHCIGCQITSAY